MAIAVLSVSLFVDCEQTAQVWANCADIEVVAAGGSSSSGFRNHLRADSHDGHSTDAEAHRRGSETTKRVAKTPAPTTTKLPKGELVWKWSDANSGISGGSVLLSNNSVGFGTFLSTGSASPGYNRTYWSLDRDTGKTNYYVEVPTAVLYQGEFMLLLQRAILSVSFWFCNPGQALYRDDCCTYTC